MVYQTNADWHTTYEALVNNSLVIADTTQKGLIQFWFRDSPTLFMLAPTGKLQVKWNNYDEKKILFKLVKNLLVAGDGEKLVVKPLRQQVWIEYPVPQSFKLYWCSDATEYVLKKTAIEQSKRCSEIGAKKISAEVKAEFFKVKNAVTELRREFRFFREPTFNEVALKSGCLNAQRLRNYLVLTYWKDDSEGAELTAKQAINLAAWLRFKQSSQLDPQLIALCKKAIDSATMDALVRARLILKTYPELVPTINSGKLEWPDETKNKWIQVFGSEPPAP
ncbi:hypothetical protein G4O51_10695 [Candidatus Bathyarchaeota archaeon A05DMB-2]|nr:hypothetical protein [Candidatus Bathyarchaeota archaeon A05DMB-2]MBT0160438.1 hypothetical protein [Candidatus Bathyarchaeota archaeon A05DMB-2]